MEALKAADLEKRQFRHIWRFNAGACHDMARSVYLIGTLRGAGGRGIGGLNTHNKGLIRPKGPYVYGKREVSQLLHRTVRALITLVEHISQELLVTRPRQV